jgi:hypothetical protein
MADERVEGSDDSGERAPQAGVQAPDDHGVQAPDDDGVQAPDDDGVQYDHWGRPIKAKPERVTMPAQASWYQLVFTAFVYLCATITLACGLPRLDLLYSQQRDDRPKQFGQQQPQPAQPRPRSLQRVSAALARLVEVRFDREREEFETRPGPQWYLVLLPLIALLAAQLLIADKQRARRVHVGATVLIALTVIAVGGIIVVDVLSGGR